MKMLLGDMMVSEGFITEEQLNEGLEKQKSDGRLLGLILVDMGYITQRNLEKAIIKQKQQVIDDSKTHIASLKNLQSAEQIQ